MSYQIRPHQDLLDILQAHFFGVILMSGVFFRAAILLFSGLLALTAQAAIDVYEFDNDVQRARYQNFIDELRCPKCQNQNLSGSDSPIAMDLRRELHELITDGRSDKEIVDFMVERYGEYILYKPRLTASTFLLWFGPLFLVVAAIIILIVIVRQRRQVALVDGPTKPLSAREKERLAALLQQPEANSGTASETNTDANTETRETR